MRTGHVRVAPATLVVPQVEEETPMDGNALPYRDPRVDQIIEDPASYFAAASARAYTQARRIVEAELQLLHVNGYRRTTHTEDDPASS